MQKPKAELEREQRWRDAPWIQFSLVVLIALVGLIDMVVQSCR